MDAVRDVLAPDVILRVPEGWPEPGPYVGRDVVMRQWQQNRETWDADTVEPITDFIGVADRVVVRMIWRTVGQGPRSNIEFTVVYTMRKRKAISIEYFWDHAEALEAVGLSEQDARADP
jgi:ketosteroid isomerase-like protein